MDRERKMPPWIFLKFFRWFCARELADFIEGDLMEEYSMRTRTRGKRVADLHFALDVILLFRPGIIRSFSERQSLTTYGMYKSYFRIGWRNLLRNSGYSFINIGGLAIAMAIAILNGLWIWDEISFNTYHINSNRIAQLTETGVRDGDPFVSNSMTYPLTVELIENYHHNFRRITRTSWPVEPIVSAGDNKFTTRGLYVDASLPEMFSFEMVRGARHGLKTPQTVMLAASFASTLFGTDDPLGKLVRINNAMDATVAGVYNDLPHNTSFAGVKFFGSWDLFLTDNPWIQQRALNDWRNHFLQVYIEVEDENTFPQVTSKISSALKFDPADQADAKARNTQLYLFPMSRWHLYPYNRGKIDEEPMKMIKMVGAIGAFILIIACINFMNLSTARSEKRCKEVGIRKTIGSVRSQLVIQFFSESFLVVLFALVIALALAAFLLPGFNSIASKEIAMPWGNAWFWTAALLFVGVTGLLAGSYPALYLSSFKPVLALKGKLRTGKFTATPRKVLVVFQFSISVVLIICTAIVYQQIQFAKNRPVGYDREGLIMVQKLSEDFYGKYEILRNELRGTGVVEEVSESMGPVTETVSGNNGWDWSGRDPKIDESFVTHSISHTHGRTVGWQFVAGRDFSPEIGTDSSGLVINEAAARFMGLTHPIGEPVSWTWWRNQKVLNYKIIGVVKDMVMDSPYGNPEPSLFYLKGFNGAPNFINIRIDRHASVSEALPKIESVFRKVIPAAPFNYQFVDDAYAQKFASEERTGQLALIFATLAIFISCLGLFGLASFVAEQRTKEIGIRKVLGASLMNVWKMLSRDFVLLVVLACVISIPLAYYLMHGWLEKYNYRINLSWWTFVLTCFLALVIALCTVSFHAIRAAIANPVKSLRSE
ncbi:MAG TPA: FtsX-like permease family protein [Chryseosolibacter sp.]